MLIVSIIPFNYVISVLEKFLKWLLFYRKKNLIRVYWTYVKSISNLIYIYMSTDYVQIINLRYFKK